MLTEQRVAIGLLTVGLLFMYIKLGRHIQDEEERQALPFGRLTPREQSITVAKCSDMTKELKRFYIEIIEGSMGQFTVAEANDVLEVGLDHLHHRKLQMTKVPDTRALHIVLTEAKTEMRKALMILGHTKSGSGFIQDDVLTAPWGRPSGRLSHELARDFQEALEEQRLEIQEAETQWTLAPPPPDRHGPEEDDHHY